MGVQPREMRPPYTCKEGNQYFEASTVNGQRTKLLLVQHTGEAEHEALPMPMTLRGEQVTTVEN